MAKKVTFNSLEHFFKLSREEQARMIESDTKELIKRLPRLKKALQMYNEVSDELYNLKEDEVQLMGETYANAVRGGEISTPSSSRAYRRFVQQLRKYTRRSIRELAVETAQQRMDSWLEHVRANGSVEEIAYAEELVAGMSDEQKIGFTKSKYFLDVENWNSEGFVKSTDEGDFSIQVLKLELYLQTYEDSDTRNIYNRKVATDSNESAIRGSARGRRGRKRK